ncbi:MAG: hypothetical protein ACTSVV_04840 [Promethearchaeota archaeon]
MPNETTIFIRNRNEKDKLIKDAIYAFTGGQKSLLIKGEGEEIATAVEVAETLKNKLFPRVEIASISLGSRPFYQRGRRNNKYSKNKRFQKDIISKIEILIKSK